MHRLLIGLLASLAAGAPALARADAFDLYTNRVLAKLPKAPGVLPVKRLTPELLTEHAGVLPGTTGALLVVRTGEGRWSKLLVQPARQKIADTRSLPILLIERFVTYREGEDQAVVVRGQDVRLFKDFLFNLDIGQVVPASVGGDIRFVVEGDKAYAEPAGKAEFYLLTKPYPGAVPPKTGKVVVGGKFQPEYFTGIYKLYDDGRRTGVLHLKVNADGSVKGHYYSGKDGKKYEVEGQVGDPHHTIEFKILYPRTVETFRGWMFTGNAQAITGHARLEQSESGFYAIRDEESAK